MTMDKSSTSIGSISNNSKISTNTGKIQYTKQGNKTPVNMNKFATNNSNHL